MKSKIISALKIILPLGFGVFLIWLFYDALCEDQKKDLFTAFLVGSVMRVVLIAGNIYWIQWDIKFPFGMLIML
jgi:hypothetical protein